MSQQQQQQQHQQQQAATNSNNNNDEEPEYQTCWKCRQSFTMEQMQIHSRHCAPPDQQSNASQVGAVRQTQRRTVR